MTQYRLVLVIFNTMFDSNFNYLCYEEEGGIIFW